LWFRDISGRACHSGSEVVARWRGRSYGAGLVQLVRFFEPGVCDGVRTARSIYSRLLEVL